MKIKKSSWHYKIINLYANEFGYPTTLCQYFWRLILYIPLSFCLLTIMPPIGLIWTVFASLEWLNNTNLISHKSKGKHYNALRMIIFSLTTIIPQWTLFWIMLGNLTEHHILILVPFLLTSVTVILGATLYSEVLSKLNHWEDAFLNNKHKKETLRKDTGTPLGVVICNYLKAKKEKVCPLIEYE